MIRGVVGGVLFGGSGTVIPLRIAEVQGLVPDAATSSAGKRRFCFRWPVLLGADHSTLAITIGNKYINGPSFQATGNAFTIEDASIESPTGVVVPLTFSGARSKEVPDGTVKVVSDEVGASAFSLSKFTRGELYWLKGTGSVPVNGNSIPTTSATVTAYTGSQSGWYDSAATTLSSTDAAGAYTFTGTALTSGNAIKPIVIGRPLADDIDENPSYYWVGDSLTAGSTDSANGYFGYGAAARAASNYGTLPYPLLRYCRSGITASNFTGSGAPFAEYCNTGVDALLTNDVSAETVASMKTLALAVWALIKSTGITRVLRVDFYANTTSTDSWATTANQTYSANWGPGEKTDQLQRWFRLKKLDGTLFDVLDLDYVKDSTDKFKWKPLTATDTTHPNELGYILAGSTLRVQLERYKPFTLASVPGYAGRYDASVTSTLLDANGVDAATGGFLGTVATWSIIDGGSNHATQTTAGYRPAYGARSIGSIVVPDFDGTDDTMTVPSGIVTYDAYKRNTVIAIYLPDTTTTTEQVFGGNGTGGAKTRFAMNNQLVDFGDTDLAKSVPVSGTAILQVGRVRNTEQRLKISADSELKGSLIRNNIPASFAIGKYPAGTPAFNGTVGLIIIFNMYIPGPQLNKIVNDIILPGPFGAALSWSDVVY